MNTLLIVLAVAIPLYVIGQISRNKRAKSKIIHVIEENCTLCQRCVKKCRRKVLEVEKSESGRFIVLKHPGKCTACRDCIISCRFNALELVSRDQQ